MSLVDNKEIASVGESGGSCVGNDGDEDENEEGVSDGSQCRCRCSGSDERTKKQRGFSGSGFSRNFVKTKQVFLYPFAKSRKQFPIKYKTRASSGSSSCAFSSGKRFGGGSNGVGNKGCYFCFMKPTTLGSPIGSQTSDPEHPNFTSGMLRAFLEKNDFYSKECNPHLDIDVPAHAREF